ncbi:MAG: M23 family metallopeptidase [Bacteroidales bacterium]|nr:M23 family metallopeptidase [Bacteroidales bacterium]MCB8999762.1 M23 family metallopeptidase [Bacteroidales bacterium]MCB9013427.1 M23 family metallopeptidase [Bacteroidales bacterium]
MASGKYRFNSSTLLYEKVKYTFRERVLRVLPFFLLTLGFSLAILFYGYDFFESPKISRLSQEQTQTILKLRVMSNELSKFEEVLSDVEYNDDHIYRTYFEVDPLQSSLRNAGFGGSQNPDAFATSKYRTLVNAIDNSLDRLAKKLVVQSKSYDEVVEMAVTKEKRLAARPAIQPISIKELNHFGSSFGFRFHPILHYWRMHEGIDLTCPRGTNIFVTADGVVVEAGYTSGGYGNKIVVNHGYGYETLYGHCDKIFVKRGDRVKRGDIIGAVGSTGLSAAPHLHYEVHVNGKAVNPINYYANDLSAEEYDKMISLYANSDPSFDIN